MHPPIEWVGTSKHVRTDPGDFVSERTGLIRGPQINIHTLAKPFTPELFDGLETKEDPVITSVCVYWSTRTWMPELKGTLSRSGCGYVDSSQWIRGQDQKVGGLTVPAKLTDWIIDQMNDRLNPAEDVRDPPRTFRARILIDNTTETLSVLTSQLFTIYTERVSPYD